MAELLILVPRSPEWAERERTVMRAAVEAARELGAEKVLARRCDVYAIGVYLKEDLNKRLVYIDWDRGWDWRRIKNHLVSSAASRNTGENCDEISVTGWC